MEMDRQSQFEFEDLERALVNKYKDRGRLRIEFEPLGVYLGDEYLCDICEFIIKAHRLPLEMTADMNIFWPDEIPRKEILLPAGTLLKEPIALLRVINEGDGEKPDPEYVINSPGEGWILLNQSISDDHNVHRIGEFHLNLVWYKLPDGA